MKEDIFWYELLLKYISHVGGHEGIDYLRDGDELGIFTDKEWTIMQEISNKLINKL